MDAASLAAICSVALAVGSKIGKAARKVAISREETELLVLAASAEGVFYVVSVDQIPGSWVRVGEKSHRRDFACDDDPSVAAIYLDAFRRLCERGYVRHEAGILFVLSGEGWKAGRAYGKDVTLGTTE